MKRGFTLIEMLVVIAIIAILAGLLFSVLASAWEKGRQSNCLSNLHQMAAATLQYAQDWDDTLPMSSYQAVDALGRPCLVSAGSAVQPYLGDRRLLACPTNPDAYQLDQFVQSAGLTGGECGGLRGGGSYALNDTLFVPGNAPLLGTVAQTPLRMSEVRYPAETAIGYDGNVAKGGECGFSSFDAALEGRHLSNSNVGFLDGHAKALPTFLSGCTGQNINGKPLEEHCLGGITPYHRWCGQPNPIACVDRLTGVVRRDGQGLCVAFPR